jgi:hypothetical protein
VIEEGDFVVVQVYQMNASARSMDATAQMGMKKSVLLSLSLSLSVAVSLSRISPEAHGDAAKPDEAPPPKHGVESFGSEKKSKRFQLLFI